MKKPDFIKAAYLINTIREQKGIFSKLSILNCFEEAGLPVNQKYWSLFVQTLVIQRVGKNVWGFTDPKTPVYYKLLETIYKKYTAKSVKKVESDEKKILRLRSYINKVTQFAIELLTEKGYTVIPPEK